MGIRQVEYADTHYGDRTSDTLRGAGYEHIAFTRYDTDVCIGGTLDDAVEFALALAPAGEIIRLAGGAGEMCGVQAIAALRETFSAPLMLRGSEGK